MISIIIPTLNEEQNLDRLLLQLAGETERHEIIVADGGSADGTQTVAARHRARVISSPRGRGQQLKTGAAAANGDVLLFLHADSIFPVSGLAEIRKRLGGTPTAPGGNFRLIFDGDSGFSRWLTTFYAWIRRRGLYYGDSGIFIRRDIYKRLGGVREMALMEDYDLVRRMEKAGPTICIEDPPLVTSSRKFEGRHPVEIFFGWVKMHLLFSLGVSPERLAKMYYGR